MPFFRRKKKKTQEPEIEARRPLITGSIAVGGRQWTVREEKRQGPRKQILILTAEDGSGSEMHIRPDPGREAHTLEDVEPLAFYPLYRWFTDGLAERWEARILVSGETGSELIKFISWRVGVYEGRYPFDDGLGLRSDEELRDLLEDLRAQDQQDKE